MTRLFSTLCIALALLCSVYSIEGAVYIVTKTADTNDGVCGDADCSLREAIAGSNTTPDNDIVIFALPFFSSPQTITLSGTELVAMNNGTLTVAGPGAYRLTISGNNASRIIRGVATANVTLSGMRLTAGNGVSTVNNNSGGAILNEGTMTLLDLIVANNGTSTNAGGIRNSGTGSVMTINRCVIANNTAATSSAGGIQNFSTSTLTVLNSTFTGNVSGGGTVGGGAMQANGTVSITNSTFSGNMSNTTGGGGAINSNGSLLLLTNVTITGNSSNGNGGGLHRGTTNPNGFIRNSIISGNSGASASTDVTNSAGGLVSQGNNIIGAVGTSTGWIMSDQQNVDPLLAPLGFYGGFGMTHLPLSGSPAINMGQNCVVDQTCSANNPPSAVTTDERGVARPFGASVDVGAVEASGDYFALLPSAGAGVPYSFTLVPSNNGFTYLLNSGSFGGITLMSGPTATTVVGTAPSPGIFNGLVQIVGAPGQAFQNYRINVLSDPNLVYMTGRVVTASGIPISKASVDLIGFDGRTYSGLTNPFGYFRIEGIPSGLNGSLRVSRKGYDFGVVAIAVTDVIENVEIRAAN
ncbi:MAG: hypothetical protein DMF63_03190 [Acidobacteria bacterium]|nr:MAG: hypothetical protein DMF63_03190 [Acidobacteriota bacterium]